MITTRSTDRVDYIHSRDAALDRAHAAFDWKAYWTTGDAKHAPLLEGFVPTIFVIRRLKRRQFERVLAKPEEQRMGEAVAYGLEAVRNWPHGELVLQHKNTEFGPRLTEECLDKLFYVEVFSEVGARIVELSQLPPLSESR